MGPFLIANRNESQLVQPGVSASESETELNPKQLARVTYFWDRLRGISGGINDAVFGTFVLLIAIRVFDAPNFEKSMITGAIWAGMFLMPVFLWVVSSLRLRCNIACTIYTFITGIFLTVTLFFDSVEYYAVAISLSMIIGIQGYTLLTRILAENYGPESRGRRVGTTVMISGIVFMATSQLFGVLMDKDLGNYVWILALSAAAYYWASFVYYKMPSPRLEKPRSRFPYHTVQLFWKNRVFTVVAILWSLIEFGNYMMIPTRMELVANEQYQVNLSNTQITWLLAIVPLGFSLTTSRSWGRLFDSFRAETIQSAMGVFLVFSILSFFTATNFWWMLAAMAIFGIALGAQKILNQLWITKVVQKESVAEYVSAYSILNGIRGISAPILAYWLMSRYTPAVAGYIAAGIIASGSFGLLLARRSVYRNQSPDLEVG